MKMERLCGVTGSDVVTRSDDFPEMERKSCFRVKHYPRHHRLLDGFAIARDVEPGAGRLTSNLFRKRLNVVWVEPEFLKRVAPKSKKRTPK